MGIDAKTGIGPIADVVNQEENIWDMVGKADAANAIISRIVWQYQEPEEGWTVEPGIKEVEQFFTEIETNQAQKVADLLRGWRMVY